MNSIDTQTGRTLARVGSAEAERFLGELANLAPGEAAWRRFQRSFSDMLPPRKQAFQAVAVAPYRDRQAARSEPSSRASDTHREERAAKRVAAVLASHKYTPQDTTLDPSSTLETPPPPASRTISADPDGTAPTDPLRRRITDAEQEQIEDASAAALKELEDTLNTIREDREDTEIQISDNQKQINETNKAVSALEVLSESDSSVQSLIDRLEESLATLNTEQQSLVDLANTLAEQAAETLDDLRSVAQFVR